MDVTFLKDGIFSYWAGPVLDIPAVAGMKMTGHIYVESNSGGSVGLGTSFYSPAVARRDGGSGRGMCQAIKTFGKSSAGKWIKQEADLYVMGKSLTKGDPFPDTRMEKWHIHIVCSTLKDARMVLYIDDISIEGTVPGDWEATTDQAAEKWLAAFESGQRKSLDEFEKKLHPIRTDLKRMVKTIPGDETLIDIPERPWGEDALDLLQQIRDKADELVLETAPGRTELPTVVIPVSDKPEEYLRHLRDTGTRPVEASIENLKRLAGRQDRCLVFVKDAPITNYRVLPDTKMIDGLITDKITISASPGEYEPASFVLLPAESTTVTFQVSDLTSGSNVIANSALDLKVVKVWYQGGIHHTPSGKSILTPELLLNDDDLVKLDYANQRNIVRDIDSPRDSPELLPVHIPAMTAKQFWLTVHVPDGVAPGTYNGTITVQSEELDDRNLMVALHVLPITLEEPEYEYSIYYRAQLAEGDPDYVSSDLKTPPQLSAEFRDLKAHGITNPNVYQKYNRRLDAYIDLRDEAGLKSDALYFLGMIAGNYHDALERAIHIEGIREVVDWARGRGISDVYFAGSDKARGEELKSQRETWEAVHDAGGKVFVACSTGFFELVGDILDLPVVARESKDDVPRVHALGHKIHYYSNPAGATEQPYTFRYKFGHWLDRSGMDGVQTYVYQHGEGPGKGMGRMWDDFDFIQYRVLAFTYPTVDGVVDTLQWEGVREGVDDVRYLTTLRKAIAAAKEHQDPDTVKMATETEHWLTGLNIEGDLQKLRWEIAQKIIAINKAPSR